MFRWRYRYPCLWCCCVHQFFDLRTSVYSTQRPCSSCRPWKNICLDLRLSGLSYPFCPNQWWWAPSGIVHDWRTISANQLNGRRCHQWNSRTSKTWSVFISAEAKSVWFLRRSAKRWIEKILQVEKDHVYQKSRHTRGPIRQIIAEMSEQEDSDQWFSIHSV